MSGARHTGEPIGVEGFARIAADTRFRRDVAWAPVVVRIGSADVDGFRRSCARACIACADTLDRQLAELAAVRMPGSARDARRAFVAQRIAALGDPGAGVWAWYPWLGVAVHVLERDDFFDVVTDRNRDKLTGDELRALRGKRVGVVGLSVGGEAAVTIAQEHLCGEIVLADFDRLDLSNLNRLGAGVDELSLPKTTIAARRITRIDPYLHVTVFEEGVTDATADAFLDGLDLLVEECDDLRMKYELRVRARDRRLDIVFAADERGFLSVEPYASRPDLEPFHGRVAAAPLARAAYPDQRAFMRSLTEWLGGWDGISERSRSSLERIGEEIVGYPQLASEARYAAGQLGHVARRLLLGERLAPFVGSLDLDELMAPPVKA